MTRASPDDDARHMAHALSLGARGLGRVWPWPSVGCVLVKDGRILGRGTSDAASLRHGEIVALDQAGAAARGATAYMTLEPCSHQGRTPPCATALIKAGVARVVAALEDPNPQVSGNGFSMLRAAGIEVALGVGAAQARRQHIGFLKHITTGRPMVTLKLAATLDGRIATATGESRWITGPDARRLVHGMRLGHDAVLVGGGTARADDPTLTVRDIGAAHQPVRIVASRRLTLPWPNRLAATMDQGPVWLAHGLGAEDTPEAARWREVGASLIDVPVSGGQLSPQGLLQALGDKGLTRVFCEGGGALAASLLQANLVDELIVMSAGFALGAEGQPSVGALGVSALKDVTRFELVDTRRVGNDTMQHWRTA